MADSKHSNLQLLLLSPLGKTTRIGRRHFRVIDDYLGPGDRIAWQRPWGIIHTAMVLKTDPAKKKICVFERGKNENGIEVAPKWVNLEEEWGQLYRCDEDIEEIPFAKKLRIMLNKLGEKGYNIWGKNCQTLVDECAGKGKDSFQSKWFGVNVVVQTIKSFGKSITAELIEVLFGGANTIGVVTVIGLQVALFLVELHVAYNMLKDGQISWKHFAELVIRQFSMALFSCVGSAAGGALTGLLAFRVILWVVMTVVGALMADALLDWVGSDNRFVRYLGWMAGGIVASLCCCLSPGWVTEILLACILGFAGLVVGHVFGYSASWLFNKGGTDSRVVHDLSKLRRGDHITTYEWFLHPYCHSIFVEAMPNGTEMKIIRNTYQRGVVEEVVPFKGGDVYCYNYHSSECYDNDHVINKARSKLGEQKYSLFTYSCKTFAKECKSRDSGSCHSSKAAKEIVWDRYFAEMVSEPGIPEAKIRDLSEKLQMMMRRVSCFPMC
ncbi:hypothetical protein HOLleu_13867 [Holothuria leucospilota]|uniref:LRAT domain-containing protein n=1 Tax=Holothuria leucospilota TaxID=206669 RepID=A0A9Q1HBA2_HOLLE|nr:hypothetical protein HOLleu_13867 [Holothuria leucospilota]